MQRLHGVITTDPLTTVKEKSGSLLTIFNTFKQFSDFNLITTDAESLKVILGSSAAKRHNIAF